MLNSSKKLPSCPYCKAKLRYFDAWLIKSDIVYKCPHCSRISAVLRRSSLAFYSKFSLIFSLIFFLFFSCTGGIKLRHIFLIALPLVIFYLLVPLNVELDTLQNRFAYKINSDEQSQEGKSTVPNSARIGKHFEPEHETNISSKSDSFSNIQSTQVYDKLK